MRLEGWHVVLLLAMLALAAAIVVTVTLIVRWTVRHVRKSESRAHGLPPE